MIRRPPRSTLDRSSAASDVYKRQIIRLSSIENHSQYSSFTFICERAEIVSKTLTLIRKLVIMKYLVHLFANVQSHYKLRGCIGQVAKHNDK
eukprot:TRINITY_DN6095_c0_g1_i15.p3 TRINITY_DN6095_c0_g1~~TRINITY_DN6095_c0_g1_i15.p3  ORF type:complete len:100 (+),score=18.79 TRINITY_DN6095_c0_g1_i15:26-301(+)